MIPQCLLSRFFMFLFTVQILSTGNCQRDLAKLRDKREWIVPTKKITENIDYSRMPYVAKIRSDLDMKTPLRYTLMGPGVNEAPVGMFMVDENGWIHILSVLDREERENYTLIGLAWFSNNSLALDGIKINFMVEDQNDNAPVFIQAKRSSVYEGSRQGTFVTQVAAKDADKEGTLHSQIAYSITKQEPDEGKLFFGINKTSGIIFVNDASLDREKHSSYVLTVQAADMFGGPGGLSATATLTVDLLDVNDNIPTLEKDEYSASIDENVAPIEVLEIQALDSDEEWTDNWVVIIEIVSGNEDGFFTIITDPKTNKGVLMLVKPADFEAASNMNLNLAVTNVALDGAPFGDGGSMMGADGSAGGSGSGGSAGGSGSGGSAGGSGSGGSAGGPGSGGPAGGPGSGGSAGGSGSGDSAGGPGSGGSASGPGSGGSAGGSGSGGSAGRPGSGGSAGGPGSSGSAGGSGSGGPSSGGLPGGPSVGSTVIKKKSYSVKISVKNRPDAPKFKPKVKPMPVSENSKDNSIPRVIGTYQALDGDTGQTAENVRYAKGFDPDNWISIDMQTSEIKLNKLPDRESPFVVNGTYYAKILCMTNELNAQTSTGTIALQVEDQNDNCPKLLDDFQFACSDANVINITAEDTDGDPNSAPLEFSLVEEKTRGKWNIQRINDVSASLLAEDNLWPGLYQITMKIRDNQGLACPEEQVLDIEVCTCSDGISCSPEKTRMRSVSSIFGATGIICLILGFLLLLVVPMMLLKCMCGHGKGHFIELPFDSKQHLMHYYTEGIDKDHLLDFPQLLTREYPAETNLFTSHPISIGAMNDLITKNEADVQYSNNSAGGLTGIVQRSAFGGFFYDDVGMMELKEQSYEMDEPLPASLLEKYYLQKTMFLSEASSHDILQTFQYEGDGSTCGSLHSCGYDEVTDDLEFLNNLGSKFKPLAEVCETGLDSPDLDSFGLAPTDLVTTASSIPTTCPITSPSFNDAQSTPIEISQSLPVQRDEEPLFFMVDRTGPTTLLSAKTGQDMYYIDTTNGAERLITQANGHVILDSTNEQTLTNNITHDTFSPTGPPNPMMINNVLFECSPTLMPCNSPSQVFVMVQENVPVPQQLPGDVLFQKVETPTPTVMPCNSPSQEFVMVQENVPVPQQLPGDVLFQKVGSPTFGVSQRRLSNGLIGYDSVVFKGVDSNPLPLKTQMWRVPTQRRQSIDCKSKNAEVVNQDTIVQHARESLLVGPHLVSKHHVANDIPISGLDSLNGVHKIVSWDYGQSGVKVDGVVSSHLVNIPQVSNHNQVLVSDSVASSHDILLPNSGQGRVMAERQHLVSIPQVSNSSQVLVGKYYADVPQAVSCEDGQRTVIVRSPPLFKREKIICMEDQVSSNC